MPNCDVEFDGMLSDSLVFQGMATYELLLAWNSVESRLGLDQHPRLLRALQQLGMLLESIGTACNMGVLLRPPCAHWQLLS